MLLLRNVYLWSGELIKQNTKQSEGNTSDKHVVVVENERLKANTLRCVDCSLLTEVVSAGTDHRPFWYLLADALFCLIAVYITATSSDFSTEESDLLLVSPGSQ